MSYSIIGAILLATVTLSSCTISFTTSEPNVLARFYSNYAQFYRPALLKSFVDSSETTVLYKFYFTEKEFLTISEKSLTLLYADVIQRTIIYHPMPNFEVNGTRYYYRSNQQQNDAVEIELVNPNNRLFRYVNQPNRYFYLSSFDNLEYVGEMPVVPYYEVLFLCNSSYSTTQSPLLSYIDTNFYYKPRYVLDLPLTYKDKQSQMYAFSDIHNIGEQKVVVKRAELIADYVYLNSKFYELLLTSFSSLTSHASLDATGTYIYQLSNPSLVTMPPRSVTSLQFFQTNITAEPFAYYSSVFQPVNSTSKLPNVYNLTLYNTYLPNGQLSLREQGRLVGQINLPDLFQNDTYKIMFGSNSDVSYTRKVQLVENDYDDGAVTYYVEYVFDNYKLSKDVRVFFTESFELYTYFQLRDVSVPNEKNDPSNLVLTDTNLRGYVYLPLKNSQKTVSYKLTVYKYKSNFNFVI